MTELSAQASLPRWMLWTSRVLSAIPVLLMTMSAVFKLSHAPNVVDGFGKSGIAAGLITPIGLMELGCVVLYLLPPTAVLGAIFMVGYLGGAVLLHLRAGETMLAFSPFLVGVFAWAGLWLREPRLQSLLPLRKQP